MTPARAGAHNRTAVLREIVLHGPLPRTGIADRLGLSGAAVSRITQPLIKEGLVRELPDQPSAGGGAAAGRRPVPLDLNPDSGYVLGFGIGATLQTVTLVNLRNRVIGGVDLNLPALGDPDAVVDRLAGEARRLIDTHLPGRGRERLLGGFAMVAGAVDTAAGIVRYAPYLGDWRDVPLRSRLAAAVGIPIGIGGLSNSIALTEALFGVARGLRHVLCTMCAVGLGTGLILNGRLVTGHHDSAGIVGLMEVPDASGRVTTLDRVAGGRGLLERLYGREVEFPGDSMASLGRELFAAIERDREGDLAVAAVMGELGWRLGFVTAQAVRFVAPEIFVIAGPLSGSPNYVAAARKAMDELLPATLQIEVAASTITGPVSGGSASCAMAICEYLFEGNLELPTPPPPVFEEALPEPPLSGGLGAD